MIIDYDLYTETWDGTRHYLAPGDLVRVKAYGEGARLSDVGRVGVVGRLNRTRVVVDLDDFEGGSRDVRPSCLRYEGTR